MTKCKLCKKVISDETEYCVDCADKKDLIANESYLDELLNSVQNKTTTASDIYKPKKETQSNEAPDVIGLQNDISHLIDSDDLDDFEKYDFMQEFEDPIIIKNEELYSDIDAALNTDFDGKALDIGSKEGLEDTLDHNIDTEFLNMYDGDEKGIVKDEHIENDLDDLIENLDMDVNKDLSTDNDSIADIDDTTIYDSTADIDDIATDDSTADIDDTTIYDNTADVDDTAIDSTDIDDSYDNEYAYEDETDSENSSTPESELLGLLNQFNPDNQIEDDLQAISDLLGGISTDNQAERETPEDVGEVFSEALEAVTDLSDPDQGIQYISHDSPDDKAVKEVKKDKKKGLFAKIFANIDDDISTEDRKSQEEAAAKEARKKKKKTKGKKGQSEDKEEGEEASTNDMQESETAENKATKKVKKPKKEEKKIEVLDDEVDQGRINKLGASIVLLFFGLLVIILLISTNIFSYSLSIKNATDYFGRQRYTQAYNEVYGIELKDEDIELYDKIMTVMFVNKQLNSYNNYYNMRKYPEALDSLLKGLQRYDKYIELGTMLGIKTDLDYVRGQMVAELYNAFSITEDQAVSIINSESQVKYSISVYDVILENILFYN